MIERFRKDETGITMGLAVVMLALIGVMGAGLLVFVMRDLEAVIENNRGQRAFEMADAGARVARGDAPFTSGCPSGYSPDGENVCTGTFTFEDGEIEITIRKLEPSTDETETDDPNHAPVVTSDASFMEFYRVNSIGRYSEAVRQVEAIYEVNDFSIPMAYYTSNERGDSIDIRCNAEITGMSLFSQGGIQFKAEGAGDVFFGIDKLYGDWTDVVFNPPGRPGGNNMAGMGTIGKDTVNAKGKVEEGGIQSKGSEASSKSGSCPTGGSTDIKLGTRDFDGENSNPKMVESYSSGNISFPFDPKTMDLEAENGELDSRMSFLRDIAIENGTYLCDDDVSGDDDCEEDEDILDEGDIVGWPENSTYETVVYIRGDHDDEGQAPTMKWDVPGSCVTSDAKRGILVIDGRFLEVQGGTAPFSGVTLAHGGRVGENDNTFESLEGSCWEGPVSSRGETTLGGKGGFFLPGGLDPGDVPILGESKLWSWREVYSAD